MFGCMKQTHRHCWRRRLNSISTAAKTPWSPSMEWAATATTAPWRASEPKTAEPATAKTAPGAKRKTLSTAQKEDTINSDSDGWAGLAWCQPNNKQPRVHTLWTVVTEWTWPPKMEPVNHQNLCSVEFILIHFEGHHVRISCYRFTTHDDHV